MRLISGFTVIRHAIVHAYVVDCCEYGFLVIQFNLFYHLHVVLIHFCVCRVCIDSMCHPTPDLVCFYYIVDSFM